MTWQILIGISVLLSSFATVLQRLFIKQEDSDPQAFSIVFQILTGVLIGLFGLVTSVLHVSNLSGLVINLIFMSVLYGFANVFIYKSLKHIEISNFTIIFSIRALFSVVASTLFLGEGLSLKQLLGTGFLILGIIVINFKSSKFHFGKSELWALLAAICFGLANVNDRILVKSLEVYFFTSIAFIFPAIMLSVIYHNHLNNAFKLLLPKVISKMVLLCSLYGAGAIAFFMALQTASNTSQVVTVNLSGVIVTVLMGILFLRERDNLPNKIIGTLLAFAGQLLII